MLNVAGPEWRRLAADELQLLHTIGEMLGTAVERARLFARSQEAGALEERNRLAREIHDTLAQGLAATALQLETADALLESGGPLEAVRESLRRALATTRENLEEARRSVHDLRATPLQGQSLADAIASLCSAASAQSGLDVQYAHVGAAQPLSTRVEVALYRVAQEALANAIRHANASRVDVRLECRPDRVSLTVTDDGTGFDPSTTSGGRFGLTGMRERARLLGGELTMETARGAGTRLHITVPTLRPL